MSAVRRPSLQRAYIREVSKQTTILRLQGMSRHPTKFLLSDHLGQRFPLLRHNYLCRRVDSQSLGSSLLAPAPNSIPCGRSFSCWGNRHVCRRGFRAHSSTAGIKTCHSCVLWILRRFSCWKGIEKRRSSRSERRRIVWDIQRCYGMYVVSGLLSTF